MIGWDSTLIDSRPPTRHLSALAARPRRAGLHYTESTPMQQGCTCSLLRSATSLDLKNVASWIRSKRECELWAGGSVAFPIDQNSLPSEIGFGEGNTFSLVIEEELVAFGQLIRKNSQRGHLARLIVNPALRGKGYGETLVRALLARARKDSFERVTLNVDIANGPALSLYAKLGFADAQRPSNEPAPPGNRFMETQISSQYS